MQLGAFTITPVLDGVGWFHPRVLFAARDDTDWAPHRHLLAEDGRLELPVGAFLITGGPQERVVLIDAGVAKVEGALVQGGAMLDNLAALGVAPSDITDVVLTHLHRDHIGWCAIEGRPVFDRAVHHCNQLDWEYFVDNGSVTAAPIDDPHARVARSILPVVADRIELWSGSVTVAPGIDLRCTPGHTPGSAIVTVSSGTERAVLLGDVAHCPVELIDSEWEGVADVDPELAARTREAVARELESDDVIAGAHFAGMQFGRLLQGSGKRQWVVT